MKYSYFKSLSFIRTLMTILNLIIITFLSSVLLFSTKYIVSEQLSRDFLNQISHIPHHPLYTFFGSLLLFLVLVFIMYNRGVDFIKNDKKLNILSSVIEVVICLGLIYLLYMGYNGILFLVFCDFIYHLKDERYSKWFVIALIFIYLVSSYDVFSALVPITNINAYFEVYGFQINGLLMIIKSSLETVNIILFIAFIIIYIADEIQENKNITEELSMVSRVNQELKDYAAITEKIGESNERKRLAREIHDTLGHALTGIAAGIDACIAIVENNPQATKNQLEIISKVVRQGIGDVRNSLNKLRPGALEEHGFKGAIEKMISEFSGVSDLKINLDYRLDNVDFENTKEDIFFRIIQESITNGLRHGGASIIDIALYKEKESVFLKIQDNGIGCKEINYGFGLKQMQERVAMINGQVHFDGTNGFLTVVKIPMQRGECND